MDAVEAQHYPLAGPTRQFSFFEILLDSLGFLGLLVVMNLLALIVYLLANLAAPVVFWAVNGFLLGREYFQLVAARRLGRQGADALRKRHRLTIWATGAVMAAVYPEKAESPFYLVAGLGLLLFGLEGLLIGNLFYKLIAYTLTAVPLTLLAYWVARKV